MVRKDSLFLFLVPSMGDSRRTQKSCHRRDTGWRGVRGASPLQLGTVCWCHKHRVSVLACTPPLAVVISYSTAHRGVWACTTAPKDTTSPHRHKGFATVLQPTGDSQGLVFAFSHSAPVKYGTGAETSAPVGSVWAPKSK